MARMAIALYRGEFTEGKELLAEQWAGFRQSHMNQVPILKRVFTDLRERLALVEAADAPAGSRRRNLLSKVARTGRRFAKAHEPYAAGWGRLLQAGAANLSGEPAAALGHLEAAERKFADAEMAAYVAVTKRRRGALIGGDEGRELIAEADAWLTGQGIVNPVAWSRMYAPGFE